MNKLYFLVLIFLLFCNLVFPQGKKLPVNLSLVYPVSINQSYDDDVNFNLGIIGSEFNNLNGFGVNSIFSVLDGNVNGVQVNGIYSETRKNLNGIQFTLGVNTLTEGGRGIIFGGVGNLIFDDFHGLQTALIGNLNFENSYGVQLSGVYNLTAKNTDIAQVSAAGNITGSDVKGLQFALLFNLAGGLNKGMQTSAFNLSLRQHGFQLGLANICEYNKGLQLGIINMVDKEQEGVSLGLFYSGRKTKVQLLLTGGNFAYGSVGVRFKTNNIYTMFNLGTPISFATTEKSVMFTYRVGYSFDFNFLNLNADAGFSHLSSESDQTRGKPSKNQFAFSLRLGLEKQILKKLGIFVNAGVARVYDSYSKGEFFKKYILEGGIVLL